METIINNRVADDPGFVESYAKFVSSMMTGVPVEVHDDFDLFMAIYNNSGLNRLVLGVDLVRLEEWAGIFNAPAYLFLEVCQYEIDIIDLDAWEANGNERKDLEVQRLIWKEAELRSKLAPYI